MSAGSIVNQTKQSTPLSIPLVSLPLRPSTLAFLMRGGFVSTADIVNHYHDHLDKEEKQNGQENSVDALIETANTAMSGINSRLMNFSQELGCSEFQAAEYAHEIDAALDSVGLPKLTAIDALEKSLPTASESLWSGANSRCSPYQPLTAASILRSKSINYQANFNESHSSKSIPGQIVSFSMALDTLLGGGIALSELTEIVGLPGSGKTQLAMQLCVDARLPIKNGGVEGCAVVIDSEGSWSDVGSERLWNIAVAFVEHVKNSALRKQEVRKAQKLTHGGDEELLPAWFTPESILDGIHIFRVHDNISQTCTLYSLPKFLLEKEKLGHPVKLLVIDSLAFHHRVSSSSKENSTNNKLSSLSNTHNLTRMATFLMEMATEFNLAIVAINHLTTKIDTNSGKTKLVPALGESWAHSVTSRVMIDHCHPQNGEVFTAEDMRAVRTCTLIKSPHKAPGTALFTITNKGIRGVQSRC